MKLLGDDLFNTPLDQTEMDFANEGGETFICGNPPYLGSTWQSAEQKDDLRAIFDHRCKNWKSLDYVAGWFMKAADYGLHTPCAAAYVSTNSICQGQQVPILWPLIFKSGCHIHFAHTSFKWANLVSHNAGVTVAIVAVTNQPGKTKRLFSVTDDGVMIERQAAFINAYLVAGADVVVDKAGRALCGQSEMSFGNKPVDGGHLLLSRDEVNALGLTAKQRERFIRRIYGSAEFIRGLERYCLWIEDQHLEESLQIEPIQKRVEAVRAMRLASTHKSANEMATRAHQMRESNIGLSQTLVMPPSPSPCSLSKTRLISPNAPKTSCWRVKRISPRRLRTFTTQKPCLTTCAPPTRATMKCWSASTLAASLKTTPSGWKSCLSFIRR